MSSRRNASDGQFSEYNEVLKSPLLDGTLASQQKAAPSYNNAFTLGGTDINQESLANQLKASGKDKAEATEVATAYKQVARAQGLGGLSNTLNDRVIEEE